MLFSVTGMGSVTIITQVIQRDSSFVSFKRYSYWYVAATLDDRNLVL